MYSKKESAIERDIVYYLTVVRKIFCFKLKDQTRRGENLVFRKPRYGELAGIADLCVFHKGRVDWIEVKSKTGRQSPHQKAFEAECKKEGINYYLVRDFKEVMKIYE